MARSSVSMLVALGLVLLAGAQPQAPGRRDDPRTLFGKTIRNDFVYFDDAPPAPEYLNYSQEEAAYAQAILSGQNLAAQRANLNAEFIRNIPKGNDPVPRVYGSYQYYAVQSVAYPIWFRQHVGRPELGEQLVLDENKLAARLGVDKVFRVGVLVPNADGSLLAVGVDLAGTNVFDVFFFAMPANFAEETVLLPVHVPGVAFQLEWGCDNRTVFFRTPSPATGIASQVHAFNVALGVNTSQPFFECPPAQQVLLTTTESRALLLASCDTGTGNHVFAMNLAAGPCTQFSELMPPREGVYTLVSQDAERFYILTNADGAVNYKVMMANASTIATPSEWAELIPERPDVYLLQVSAFSTRLVVWERSTETGALSIRIETPTSGKSWRIPTAIPETVLQPAQGYGIDQYGRDNFNLFKSFHFTDTYLLYLSQTLRNPVNTLAVNLTEDPSDSTLFDEDVVENYDASEYQTQRIFVPASDGAAIPVSLVVSRLSCSDFLACPPYRQPLLLDAYGAFGKTVDPTFDYRLLSLLRRGFTFAIAHVRGSDLRGPAWHYAATGVNKSRSIGDYLAVMEFFIALNATTPALLVVTGLGVGAMLPLAALHTQQTRGTPLARTAIIRAPEVDLVISLLDSFNETNLLAEFGNPYTGIETLTAQLAVDQYQVYAGLPASSINSSIFLSAKSANPRTVQDALQLSALFRLTGAVMETVVLAGLPSPVADEDYSSEFAYVLSQVGRTDAAKEDESDGKLAGWLTGVIVLSTFAGVLIIVWIGIRHRGMLEDLFFLRVRNTASTYSTPESNPLLASSAASHA